MKTLSTSWTIKSSPLAKQAENARKFLDLDGQRKAIYLDVLVAQIKENKAELELTEEELTQVQELLTSYYQKREELEGENQTLKRNARISKLKWPRIKEV